MTNGKTEVKNYSDDEWEDVECADDFDDDWDPSKDEQYRDAMLKAKETQKSEVKNEDDGEWNLL